MGKSIKKVKMVDELKINNEEIKKTNEEIPKPVESKSEIQFRDVFQAMQQSFSETPPPNSDKIRDDIIKNYLKQRIQKYPVAAEYNIMFLFDEGTMVKKDADNIYSAATKFLEKKSMLLVLYSSGGVIGSAYLIGKLCR